MTCRIDIAVSPRSETKHAWTTRSCGLNQSQAIGFFVVLSHGNLGAEEEDQIWLMVRYITGSANGCLVGFLFRCTPPHRSKRVSAERLGHVCESRHRLRYPCPGRTGPNPNQWQNWKRERYSASLRKPSITTANSISGAAWTCLRRFQARC